MGKKHSTVSLMSHIITLILRQVMDRVCSRTLQEIAPKQYGCLPDNGTRNALFVLRIMSEIAIEKKNNIYTCFIDYSKTLDTVRYAPLIDLLKAMDVDSHNVQLLAKL